MPCVLSGEAERSWLIVVILERVFVLQKRGALSSAGSEGNCGLACCGV
jgi:hypothetical protein